jgi:phage shock protein A
MGEAFSGISEEMADVGLAMQRAEDKTAQLQARAGAIDELLASGALEDAPGPAQDPIQSELDRMSAHSDVELEMARLKAALPAGGAPAAISAGEQDADTAPLPRSELASGRTTSAEDLR